VIESEGIHSVSATLNCRESGLGIRMFTPLAALGSQEITITGEGSLVDRPMNVLIDILPQLGVIVSAENGKLPLKIRGPLRPKDIEVDGSLSSQFLTGLLMAYSAAGARDVSISVRNLKSKPYIDLTLEVMRLFGLKTPENRSYETFYFGAEPANNESPTINYTVEGDWSGAAFLLVAAAVTGQARINGLLNTSRQADKRIVDALLDAGANVQVGDDHVDVSRNELDGFVFDANDCPDLIPPLVAFAASCKGVSRIRGVNRLAHKESNRAATLQEEFSKLGTRIDLVDDEMVVYGHEQVRVNNHVLNSHHDHRIAMACAVAALNADFEVQIRNADAVKKSYPSFWDHLQQLNAAISLKPFTTDNTFRL
jgi:3-phosphoshikimate 1-carboxyvinyltransferase